MEDGALLPYLVPAPLHIKLLLVLLEGFSATVGNMAEQQEEDGEQATVGIRAAGTVHII